MPEVPVFSLRSNGRKERMMSFTFKKNSLTFIRYPFFFSSLDVCPSFRHAVVAQPSRRSQPLHPPHAHPLPAATATGTMPRWDAPMPPAGLKNAISKSELIGKTIPVWSIFLTVTPAQPRSAPRFVPSHGRASPMTHGSVWVPPCRRRGLLSEAVPPFIS